MSTGNARKDATATGGSAVAAEQLVVTHCLKEDSVLGRAGYSVRATSTQDVETLEWALRLEPYELPLDVKNGAVLLSQTPRRLARVPALDGKAALFQSSYLPEDTIGRVHSFISHVIVNKNISTRSAVMAWGAEDWMVEGPSSGGGQSLPRVSGIPEGGLVGDRGLSAFLGEGSADEDQSLTRVTFPSRVEHDQGARRRWVRWALQAFLLSLDPAANRTRVYVLAEPGVVALLVYAINRLLPAKLAGDFLFTTYEPSHTTLRENKEARVVGGYCRNGLEKDDVDAIKRRGHVVDTLREDSSLGQDLDSSWPLEPLLLLAAEGDWKAIDAVQALWAMDPSVVPGVSASVLAEALTVQPLAVALREGTATPEGLLRLKQSRLGQSHLRGSEAKGLAWKTLRPVWWRPEVISGFPELITDHRVELLGELEKFAASRPVSAWLPRWSLLRPLLSEQARNEAMAGLLQAAGKSKDAEGLSTSDRLRLLKEWSDTAKTGSAFPSEAQWLLRPGPGSDPKELVLAPDLRPALAGAAACLAVAQGTAGRALIDALPEDRLLGFLSALERFPDRAGVLRKLLPKGDRPPTALVDRVLGKGGGPLPSAVERFLLDAGCDGASWIPYWREGGRLEAILGRLGAKSPFAGKLWEGVVDAMGPRTLRDPHAERNLETLIELASDSASSEVVGRLEAWALLQRVFANPDRATGTPSAIAEACRLVGHPRDVLAKGVFLASLPKKPAWVDIDAATDATGAFLLRAFGDEDAALDAAFGVGDDFSKPGKIRGRLFNKIVSEENWNRLLHEHADRLEGSGLQRRTGEVKTRSSTQRPGPPAENEVLTLGKFRLPRRPFEIAVAFLIGAGIVTNFSVIYWRWRDSRPPAANPLVSQVQELKAQVEEAEASLVGNDQERELLKAQVASGASAKEAAGREIAQLKARLNSAAASRPSEKAPSGLAQSLANLRPIQTKEDAFALAQGLDWIQAGLPDKGDDRDYAKEVARLARGMSPLADRPEALEPSDGFLLLPGSKSSEGMVVVVREKTKPEPLLRYSLGESDLQWGDSKEIPNANRVLAVSGTGASLMIKGPIPNSLVHTLSSRRLANHDFKSELKGDLATSFPFVPPDLIFAVSDPVGDKSCKRAAISMSANDKAGAFLVAFSGSDQPRPLTEYQTLHDALKKDLREGGSPHLSFDAESDRLVVGARGGDSLFVFKTRDQATPLPQPIPITPGQRILDWAHAPKGSRLFFVTGSQVWTADLALDTMTPVELPGLGPGPLRSLAVSPGGNYLAVGDESGAVRLASWNESAKTMTPLFGLGHGGAVLQVGFSPDGGMLAVLVQADKKTPGKGVLKFWRIADWDASKKPVQTQTAPVQPPPRGQKLQEPIVPN